MTLTKLIRAVGVAVLSIAMAFGSAAPALPAQADLDLIQSYVGNWRGSGTMKNGSQPQESVRCRLDVTRATAEKINFSGRCTVAGSNLSMNGTMAYITAANRYEAAMTSNTDFAGTAIGRRSGSAVNFNLQAQQGDGTRANVSANFGLRNGKINVVFTIRNSDGTRMVATVPFDRQ